MADGARLASAALRFVGVPFRLYGRDPAVGLDCVGLVAESLRTIGREPFAPTGYRLRNSSIDHWLGEAKRSSLYEVAGAICPGDVLLCATGPAQQHLMIATDDACVVHAHAGLRRVVLQPLACETHLLRQWRLSEQNEET